MADEADVAGLREVGEAEVQASGDETERLADADEAELRALTAELAKIQRSRAMALEQIELLKVERAALETRFDAERRNIDRRNEARERQARVAQEMAEQEAAQQAARDALHRPVEPQLYEPPASATHGSDDLDDLEAYLENN
ncbi:hypothetical protein SDRG_10299 [Saprolegnia diclina VS20]|uniref:Uncharacterized protein n=1 Tax=Saprolegnia diclina (strain VS20) TaxID=1156394 RepID=T0RIE8_SAPDV|nr:hypothetical protein SDRG_10299 [Saprolegnia diclina VS20]EQC32103.1 hypothetical protein SDRG_10299 [Saprolegnia diclina VS20]|eukprot:XP_008614505.1 hypothetical protein SDRG_10299 [Saprolegnia diclina VS20]